ncbi:polyketide beta-ketoacyl-synthase [Crassisporium funariophilum]|nr:polyketide beta-ketoacyl-synthase [Crassisporium funariophilum]
MADLPPSQLVLPVFGGQGSLDFNTHKAYRQILRYETLSSSGQVLMNACYTAFHAELGTLSAEELKKVDICTSDFEEKDSLIVPPNELHARNPATSGPRLLVIQALRYLSFAEITTASLRSPTPFSDILRSNSANGIGILGFSSGIIAASVVATSFSTLTFITRAVEAYRLALWIGIRSQLYRVDTLARTSRALETGPWSYVLSGIRKIDIREAIAVFNKRSEVDLLYMTAVMNDNCVTVSGCPDQLSSFLATLSVEVIVHQTTIHTLYHAPSHLNGIRAQVLEDISSRHICFPTSADLIVPIRSTFTGDLIAADSPVTGTLVEQVVDMVLTQPVNWDTVVQKTTMALYPRVKFRLINVGPGTGLVTSLERAITAQGVELLDHADLNHEFFETSKVKQEPIAIIGMAVNMPGAANVAQLWDILVNGVNTVEEIPHHRFNVSDSTNALNTGRNMKAHTGNFIDSVDEFDHKFFNISPREAKNMDPQQRVLLHVAYEALEDAGYVPNSTPSFNPEAIGCFIGAATADYVQNLRSNIDLHYSTGTLKAFLSGRLSYCLGLGGPSIVLDTACSSSIIALQQASRALMNRDCNAALVGGVNIISSPDMFIGLDRGHFLSPSGQCKSFDSSADGYSRGEGCGVFVLKRLHDAISENDRILGIIRGVEVNQSCKAHSITHPHAPTQEVLFKQVLLNSGIDASSINMVEAHGTGTQAGDTQEMESIRKTMCVARPAHNPLYVTSIKANIGHLEAASGCASLAKILLMFRHKLIPAQISLKTLNPRIAPLSLDNTIISTINVPWRPAEEGKPRVALVDNFGAAGSNASLLVEEYRPLLSSGPAQSSSYVFGLSAKTIESLEELRHKTIAWLQGPESQDMLLSDIAYTMTARRQMYRYRLAVPAGNRAELIMRMTAASLVDVTPEPARVVFVFSGQGAQYRGMGRSLYLTSPIFRKHICECHNILTCLGFSGILSVFAAENDDDLTPMDDTEVVQLATFSLQYALARLWMYWGIQPFAVVGHSLGEYAALVTAGVLGLRDALLIVATRVRLILEECLPKTTGMVAVSLESVNVQAILHSKEEISGLSISCYNSPTDCVVSGPLPQLQELRNHLNTTSICKHIGLSVPYGYHGPAMFSIIDRLAIVTGKIMTHPPSVPVISTVLGQVVLPGDRHCFDKNYFVRHCVEPVRFEQGINSWLANTTFPNRMTWLEIGPHSSVLPMLRAFPTLSDSIFLATLRKRQDSWSSISLTCSSLYLTNTTIDWRKVFDEMGPTSCVSLPSYPFFPQRFWVPFREEHETILHSNLLTGFSILGKWVQFPGAENNWVAMFETSLHQLEVYIKGHRVGSMPLCPASVYLELAYASVTLALRHLSKYPEGFHIVLRHLHFTKPLTWKYGSAQDVTILTTVIETLTGGFRIQSRQPNSKDEITHAQGAYRLQLATETTNKLSSDLISLDRRIANIVQPSGSQVPEIFSSRTMYGVIFPRVVEYSQKFQTVQSLTVSRDGMEAVAIIKPMFANKQERTKFVVDPIFLDTLLHVAGFVANLQSGSKDAFVCNEIGSVKIVSPLTAYDDECIIYSRISALVDQSVILSDSFAISGANPRRIIARMKHIRFHRVRLNSFKAGLARLAGVPPSLFLGDAIQPVRPEYTRLSIEAKVIQIVINACGMDTRIVSIHDDLNHLGIDSLMRLDLVADLSEAFPGIIVHQQLSTCNNIQDITNILCGELLISPRDCCDTHNLDAHCSSFLSSPETLVAEEQICIDPNSSVKRIFANILEVDEGTIFDDVNLDSLGLDSLTSIEAIHRLRSECNLLLPSNFFEIDRTIHDIQLFRFEQEVLISESLGNKVENTPVIRKHVHGSPRDSMSNLTRPSGVEQPLVSLQVAVTCKAPLVLIHDGSGLTRSYRHIRSLGRNVWGINNPYFGNSRPWQSIVQMAACYANCIAETIQGPVLLGGWSFGGVVAFEVAKQLRRMSFLVLGVILIDSPSPLNHVPMSSTLIDAIISIRIMEIRKLCRIQFATNALLLGEYDPHETGDGETPYLAFLWCMEGVSCNQVDVPAWLADRSNITSIINGWEVLSSAPIKIFGIPGHHFEVFDPKHIDEVSCRLAEACEFLENQAT